MLLHPDQNLKCLLIQPKFSAFSFWNYSESCEHLGAKTPSPPLGLITVAALLPQHWTFRLLDLNVRDFSPADWAWADIVCCGGMLPQQKGLLELIDRAKADGKYLVVGGADPSSQPDLYRDAAALVIGEGESAIPVWMAAWRAGAPRGVFRETEKPDVTASPVPRFDLLDFRNYTMIGVQYSRGCPFNCEFCDIIELFGRKPRQKTPAQFLAEISRLRELGYSGHVDIVDDNFIGNKRNVKRELLPALIAWNKRHNHPFFYSTEASMNLADDDELLGAMRAAGFLFVFLGIETPDPALLLKTQKSQNTMRPIAARVEKIYRYGMVVTAGFIMGFDGEKSGMNHAMLALIEETGINVAMIGLLMALPNTQLTRRLLKEKRLIGFDGRMVDDDAAMRRSCNVDASPVDVVDVTVTALNFVTTRDRAEILEEYIAVLRGAFSAKSYFSRTLRLARALKSGARYYPRPWELKRSLRAFFSVSWQLTKDPQARWRYWHATMAALVRGHIVFAQVTRVQGLYLHFRKQVAYLTAIMETHLEAARKLPPELRQVTDAASPSTAPARRASQPPRSA